MNLNPNIRRTVELLQKYGFQTTDSGDGETHDHECDRDYAYVSMVYGSGTNLRFEAKRLMGLLGAFGVELTPIGGGGPEIEVSFDPVDETGVIDLRHVTDDMLKLPSQEDESC